MAMVPSSRATAAAEDVHDKVADADDYACDCVDDSYEYLYKGEGSIRARGRRRVRTHICNGANNGADAVTDGREYIALEIRGSGAVGILEVICATYHGGL